MKYISIEELDSICIIKINRPEALNALNYTVLKELEEGLESLEKTNYKCFIITGEGKAFVAGADIAEMSAFNEAQAKEFSKLGNKIFSKIERMQLISIAALNGFALGGGLELALACDIRYASSKAKLGLPETSLGLIPGFGGSQRLARICGLGVASEYIYSGGMFTAEEALRHGVVNKVLDPDSLIPDSIRLAKEISSRGKIALSVAKRTIQKGLDLSLDEGLELEIQNFSSLFSNPESKEGMRAFLDKRKPNF